MSRKRKAPRRRNAEAVAAWRKGHAIERSAKTYSRKRKHRKPRLDGAFDVSGGVIPPLAAEYRRDDVGTSRAHRFQFRFQGTSGVPAGETR